jgi:hypothetical protein
MTELDPRDRDPADADERSISRERRERVMHNMKQIAADKKALQEGLGKIEQNRESREIAFEDEKTRLQNVTDGTLVTVGKEAPQKDMRSGGSSSTQSAYSTDLEDLSLRKLGKRCKSAYILLMESSPILIKS